MERNPPYRYAAVPVELPRGKFKNVVYIVRMTSKDQAIKAVANKVDPESLINLNETRTFDTKKAATKYAGDKHTVYLDATKAPGEATPAQTREEKIEEAAAEKAANPVRALKNKLLR